jgi:acetyltransferase-like isoleucine patch superfamily enzyme
MNDIFTHETAICESSQVGPGTKIWAFVHILPNARIGRDCNICDHVFIENDVIVGDRVTVKCGVQIWDGVRLQDDVFVGPNVTLTNDPYPRSKQWPEKFHNIIIEQGASIGANATILPGVTVGRGAMVGAGAVVTHNVPPRAIVTGNPARIKSYSDTPRIDLQAYSSNTLAKMVADAEGGKVNLDVGESALYPLPNFEDLRGNLAVLEFPQVLPFTPKRMYTVYGVEDHNVRGQNAHYECHQFFIVMHGEMSMCVDDGKVAKEVRLDTPTVGLYLPPMVWGIQYKFSHDAVLLVLASHAYDNEDYIRDYKQFLDIIEKKR